MTYHGMPVRQSRYQNGVDMYLQNYVPQQADMEITVQDLLNSVITTGCPECANGDPVAAQDGTRYVHMRTGAMCPMGSVHRILQMSNSEAYHMVGNIVHKEMMRQTAKMTMPITNTYLAGHCAECSGTGEISNEECWLCLGSGVREKEAL